MFEHASIKNEEEEGGGGEKVFPKARTFASMREIHRESSKEREPPLYIGLSIVGRDACTRCFRGVISGIDVASHPHVDDDAQWIRSCLHRRLALFSRAVKPIPIRNLPSFDQG